MTLNIDPSLASVANFKEIKLLQSFNEAELQQIILLGKTQHFEAHTNIVIEGELTWGLYLILDGMVGIYKNNRLTGDLYDVAQLRAGSFFGEMSLVDENPRSATVRSLIDTSVFFLPKDQFTAFLDRTPELKLRFFESCTRIVIARLRELDDDYVISQYQLWKFSLKKEAS